MKKQPFLIPALVLTTAFLTISSAPAQNVGQVSSVESLTHFPNIPSRESEITMQWDMPEGDPYYYFYVFDTNPVRSLADEGMSGVSYTRSTSVTIHGLDEWEADDVPYYFHIAAADTGGNPGLTTTAGPYRIDVVPPSDAGITLPEITSSRTITLNLRAQGASEMYVSNEGYEEDGGWEDFTASKEWQLPPGGGEKTVYVRFRDLARNEAEASAVIYYMVGDADADGVIGLKDAILILQALTGADTDINPDADVNEDGKIGTEEVIHILKKISGN